MSETHERTDDGEVKFRESHGSHISKDGRALVVRDVDSPGHAGDGRWFLVVDKQGHGKYDTAEEAMLAYEPNPHTAWMPDPARWAGQDWGTDDEDA